MRRVPILPTGTLTAAAVVVEATAAAAATVVIKATTKGLNNGVRANAPRAAVDARRCGQKRIVGSTDVGLPAGAGSG